jgi:hypothetical protein
MEVQLDMQTLPRSGRVEVNINLSADIHVTATMARRRVSRLVISEIGNLLYGGDPSLIVGKRICWRVPVMLAYPDTGPVDQVGALDVDIETGEMFVTPQQLNEITDYAHYLAQRISSSSLD